MARNWSPGSQPPGPEDLHDGATLIQPINIPGETDEKSEAVTVTSQEVSIRLEDTSAMPPEVANAPSEKVPEKAVESVKHIVETAAGISDEDDEKSRRFLLRVVQPGLAGLMDGSVSTLAPIFATAFVTQNPFSAFLVGMAAATGAGISMAFSEALSDDGVLTGRGHPAMRGAITGGMTFLGGALHTLPFLIRDFNLALWIAYLVVGVELIVIAAIRHRFFGTSWWLSMAQVVGGGALVFVAAWLFGHG